MRGRSAACDVVVVVVLQFVFLVLSLPSVHWSLLSRMDQEGSTWRNSEAGDGHMRCDNV